MTCDTAELIEMLRYCRPGDSDTEKKFIDKYLEPLDISYDDYGNIYKFVGKSRVLWSCHTDTVHREEGMQELVISNGFVSSKNRNCLGGDCTTGVWLMVNMIRAEVPGVYIFHRDEEVGMKGSSYIAKTYGEELKDHVDVAIAFDRYGYNSIITHQMMERGCSQAFVDSLEGILDMGFKADDGGVYTDTYSYIDMIPECTNISVGYFNQHSKTEKQDLVFAAALCERLMKFDESKLVVKRDPTVVETSNDDWIEKYYSQHSNNYYDEIYSMAEMVRMYPEECAKILIDYGVTEDDILGTKVYNHRRQLG